MDEEFGEAFRILKPLCVAVAEGGSRQDVKALRDVIPQVQKDALQTMQDYVLFPLRLRLRISTCQQEIARDLVECMCEVLSRTSAVSWKSFHDLFTEVVVLIGHPKDSGKIESVSDELKLAVTKCISTLLNNANTSLVGDLYRPEMIPQLGHAIFVLLQLAETETSRAVRLAAVNCLMSIGLSDHKMDVTLRKQVGRIFASFLPGISMTLARIATGDSVQGHGITVASIQAWGYFVVLVLSDDAIKDASKEDKVPPSESCKVPLVVRNDVWVKETAMKLSILVDKITDLVCHSHWRVRLALVDWAGLLLLKCSNCLSNKKSPLLDILLTLAADDMKKVNVRSREVLQKVEVACTDTNSLTDALEENLMALATRLPRTLRSADDDKKLATLHLLIGYIELLGSRIEVLFLSLPHLERLGLALMQLVELDCSNIQLVAERATQKNEMAEGFSEKAHLAIPKKFFVHFRDERIFTKTMYICRLLGRYGNLELLLDHLLDLFRESTVYRKQSVLLINEIILGAAGVDVDEAQAILTGGESHNRKNLCADGQMLSTVARLLLEEYLQPYVWNLPTHIEDEDTKGETSTKLDLVVVRSIATPLVLTVQHFNSNIYLLCIFLEGIANISKVLGEDFKPLLITVLYPLLEKMGSSSAVVSETAYYAAKVVCSNIGCRSVADLIESNSDYLVNSLSKKLRRILQNPRSPSVLKVAIQNSHREILPLIQSSVEDVLRGLDQHHDQTAELFMEPLNALVVAVVKWFPPQTAVTKEACSAVKEANTTEDADATVKREADSRSIRDFFLEHHRLKQIADGCLEEDNHEDDSNFKKDEEDVEDDPIKKNLPVHVTLVVQIFERCSHFLPSQRQQLVLLVLDVIGEGALALQNWKDELLPLVHKIWQPFAARFNPTNLITFRKAFNTLCVLSSICGDFIWRRTMDDVWPKIVHFLEAQTSVSYNRPRAEFHFTAAYKLQLEILQNIGCLVQQIAIRSQDCEKLIGVCMPYLSAKQPKPFQEAALKAFDSLVLLEPDIVWLHVYAVGGVESDLDPPDPTFSTLKVMEQSTETKADYCANIPKLLERLNVR